LRGTYRIRGIDKVVVKGKTEPIGVYEVLDQHTPESFPNLMDVVNYFNEGIHHYQAARFSDAVAQFEKALLRHPQDKLSATYIGRCQYLMAHPPGAEWNGVWVMKEK
jgi:adenylate cyclase